MKDLKELKPLIKLIKEDKWKLILASIFIFLAELSEIFSGYLNGAAVESITNYNIKSAFIYLGIYFILRVLVDGAISIIADSTLQKVESKLTRKLGFYSYEKAINLPAYAYEKTSSGEIINRITNDADTLSFAFGQLLQMVSSIVGSVILIFYIFFNSWIVGIEILVCVSILFLVLKKYNPILKQVHKERKAEQDKFTSLVNESIRGVREIKTLGIKNNLILDMT